MVKRKLIRPLSYLRWSVSMSKEVMILDGLRKEIFIQRYAMPDEVSWEDCAKRVANAIASVEINGLATEWSDKFYQSIACGNFMPGGRILFGANRRQFNMLNCYRLHPEDTVESIGKLIQDTYLISCGGGGIGYNFSDVRPKGDDIQNIRWSAPGSVSVMKMINAIGEHVRSGKNRRTALIAILNIDHPDLFDFLHVKLDLGELNNFNISVGITNKFIEAVKKNKSWSFHFKGREYFIYSLERKSKHRSDTIKIVALNEADAIGRAQQHNRLSQDDEFINVKKEDLMARQIWDLIIENSWRCGDPGIYNLDLANSHTNVSYFEELNSTNPCGEIPLPKFGNCCLGHINLSNMYDETLKDVNWKKFAETIRIGIRFLDDVLTANHYPIPECRTVGEKSRRIGLGVTGLHYLLIKLGLKYGSSKCLEFLDRLFATFRNEAYQASVEIGKEKGSFPAFDIDKYSKEEFFKQLPIRLQNSIKKNGIRNAVMLTIAPCGTNSMVLGVSSGIEPIFAPLYTRRFREGNIWREEVVADKLFTEWYAANKDYSKFIGAYDIPVEEHISVQATIQKYIDSAISKTTNIPNDFDVNKLGDTILDYASYVKGFTIYRASSKGTEPLEIIDIKDKNKLKETMNNIIATLHSIESCKNGVCEL
jgi:ribonucleoside-diphosphate reductase alpha chain